jgi:hypothetical protein
MNEIFGFGYVISGEGIGLYAGATTRPDARINENFSALRGNRHWNVNFQAAVNAHGLESFSVQFYGPVTTLEELARMEQSLINQAKAADETLFNKQQNISKAHAVGYSLSSETRARQSTAKRKHYEFVSPQGETVKVHGLQQFCQQHGLTMSEMSRLAAGKKDAHKGWTRAENAKLDLDFSDKSTMSQNGTEAGG